MGFESDDYAVVELYGYTHCQVCSQPTEDVAWEMFGGLCPVCVRANIVPALSGITVDDGAGRWKRAMPWWILKFVPQFHTRKRAIVMNRKQVNRDAYALLAEVHPVDYMVCKALSRALLGEPPWSTHDLRSPHIEAAMLTFTAVAAYAAAHGAADQQEVPQGRSR